MVSCGDLVDLFFGKFPVGSVDKSTHLARINEKGVTAPIAERAATVGSPYTILLVPSHKPEAHRNLRRVEKLAGHCDHAVHQVRPNHRLSDFTLV